MIVTVSVQIKEISEVFTKTFILVQSILKYQLPNILSLWVIQFLKAFLLCENLGLTLCILLLCVENVLNIVTLYQY